jgi:hypothetical protein
MKANISRWFILLLALVCVAQAVSAAGFDVKTETVNPSERCSRARPAGDRALCAHL